MLAGLQSANNVSGIDVSGCEANQVQEFHPLSEIGMNSCAHTAGLPCSQLTTWAAFVCRAVRPTGSRGFTPCQRLAWVHVRTPLAFPAVSEQRERHSCIGPW